MNRSLSCFDYVNLALLLCSALILIYFIPVAGLVDQGLSAPWVDGSGYYLRENWLLVRIGHELLKYIVITIALIHFVIFLCLSFQKSSSVLRGISGRVVLGMLLSVSVVGLLKSHSIHACPWSMLEVSGSQFNWNKPIHGLGKCFPGGHASAGFSLFILYFAYRPYYPTLARFGLCLALVMGISMSAVQMLRGAHFLSHNLWAAWWCWLICYLFSRFGQLKRLKWGTVLKTST
ncbi:phosphatase PAP2 family protein [Acinetobacter ihumii]|uniref:phosphatase PAP2 family protein n=1 Tax=Acinetobacter ihumii TaxID=2483802 RepID=UPI00102FB789|nr:phosphatase PAP2 family protein [Acinetobacter ihumii]